MSVLCSVDEGFVLSHSQFINHIYSGLENEPAFRVREEMFAVNTPYTSEKPARKKQKLCHAPDSKQESEINFVKTSYPHIIEKAKEKGYFNFSPTYLEESNKDCRDFSSEVFQESNLKGDVEPFHGGNTSDKMIVAHIEGDNYIIPPHCSFYCQNISRLSGETLKGDCPPDGFDLVIVDPPWWNKYIRRRKAANEKSSYTMLRTSDLAQIPLKHLLSPGALVAVWCTNSQSHIDDIHNELFPSWNLSFVATWFWLKVDRSGRPICNFSPPTGKQPYERIIFGRCSTSNSPDPKDKQIIVSVPSAIHSHKPPLVEVLRQFVSSEPQTLELFARSLLPRTVSWGLEVLKLQHQVLFVEVHEEDKGKRGAPARGSGPADHVL